MTQPLSALEALQERIAAGDVCGHTWTTVTTGKDGQPVTHVHVCQRRPGHSTTWHACSLDAGHPHIVERRLVAA